MLLGTVGAARLLGRSVYGEFGMIQSTVDAFGTFAGLGLGLTATKYVAQYRQSDPARAGRILALSGLVAMSSAGLIALALIGFAPWLATHTLNAPQLSNALRVGSLILLASALNGAQTGALVGFEAFRAVALVNVVVAAFSVPSLIFGAYVGGLFGAVWALAINVCFNWAC